MVLDKLCRLHKHTAAAAAGVVHAPLERLQYLYQGAYNAGRREEFAATLALLLGKHGQAVFVGATKNILFAAVIQHFDVGEQVYHITQATLVQFRTGEVLGQNVLQALVLFFNSAHSIVNYRANLRRVCFCSNFAPTRTSGDEENALRSVFVNVFLEAVALFDKLIVLVLETIRDIL